MTNTLADLRAQLRLRFSSTSDFPDATLDGFTQDAIRIYSALFPRRWRHTITLTTGTQAYDLPGQHGLMSILSVEYPTAQTPQSFLSYADECSDKFQDKDEVYTLRSIADTTAANLDDAGAQIVFAETVATGQYAAIEYLGLHTLPTVGDDDCLITVPPAHWEMLLAFVDFLCHWKLETEEADSVTGSVLVLAQLGEEGRRAWQRFMEMANFYGARPSQIITLGGAPSWAQHDSTQERAY